MVRYILESSEFELYRMTTIAMDPWSGCKASLFLVAVDQACQHLSPVELQHYNCVSPISAKSGGYLRR